MATETVRLEECLRTGDVATAREMIREGKTGGMSSEEMLKHAASGDKAGVARMLCGEGAVDVSAIEWNDEFLKNSHVACELLACGLAPGSLATPLERALWKALLDARSSLAAAAGMMRAADSYPDVYVRLLDAAGETPSGPELMREVFSALADAETGGTLATR
jgi:hypothetical protein